MYTKEQAIRIVTQAAASYKSNLSGNNLLFVCINKARDISYIETVFTESRFLHLTGLKVNKKINDTKYSKQVYSAKGIDLASYVFPKSLSDKMCLEQQK